MVERSSRASQREIASSTGLSLGLVNAIVKNLAKRGMIKIRQVPRRRLLYYLTPQGFSEKTALLLRVLRTVQNDYQHIRSQLHRQAREMKAAGVGEIALKGDPFLLEIGCLCCMELGIAVEGLYSDNEHRVGDTVCGHILRSFDKLPEKSFAWEVQYSSLGLVRDHVVDRSRTQEELQALRAHREGILNLRGDGK